MENDSDFYYEESSDNEEVAAPPHLNLKVSLEESPVFLQADPPSPVLAPQPIPLGELSPVWELPDDGTNFFIFFHPS